MKKINKIQKLQFKLIRNSSFNSLDGNQVVDDLLNNRELWDGVIIDRPGSGCIDLIKLRDIEDNLWNTDTIYVLSSGTNNVKLQEIAEGWSADAIKFITGGQADALLGSFPSNKMIMSVWWD